MIFSSIGLFGFESYGNSAVETLEIPVKYMIGVGPKYYTEVGTDMKDEHITKKHKGINAVQTGVMQPSRYLSQIQNVYDYSKGEESRSGGLTKVDQARLKKTEGRIELSVIRKDTRITMPDKCFYLSDGIFSYPHGHPLVKQHILEKRRGLTEKDLLKSERVSTEIRNERRLLAASKDAFNTQKMWSARLKNGQTLFEQLKIEVAEISC